jgi:hypothetical protein
MMIQCQLDFDSQRIVLIGDSGMYADTFANYTADGGGPLPSLPNGIERFILGQLNAAHIGDVQLSGRLPDSVHLALLGTIDRVLNTRAARLGDNPLVRRQDRIADYLLAHGVDFGVIVLALQGDKIAQVRALTQIQAAQSQT